MILNKSYWLYCYCLLPNLWVSLLAHAHSVTAAMCAVSYAALLLICDTFGLVPVQMLSWTNEIWKKKINKKSANNVSLFDWCLSFSYWLNLIQHNIGNWKKKSNFWGILKPTSRWWKLTQHYSLPLKYG